MAEAAVTDPQAAARDYVPQSKKVLLASKLARPRTSQKLGFDRRRRRASIRTCAPIRAIRGECTSVYVVADLEDYLADAEGYLAKHPMVAVDPLLKSNRPRKEWTLDELAGDLPHLGQGRSLCGWAATLSVGQLHLMPQSRRPRPRDRPRFDQARRQATPKELLNDILEPSAKIDEKYQSWRLETLAGKVITGLIVGETPELVKLIENPLASATPIEIKKSAIGSRERVRDVDYAKGLA